jgi:hypothetical protein
VPLLRIDFYDKDFSLTEIFYTDRGGTKKSRHATVRIFFWIGGKGL